MFRLLFGSTTSKDEEKTCSNVKWTSVNSIDECYVEKAKLGTGQFGDVFIGSSTRGRRNELVAYKSMRHYKGVKGMEKKRRQILNEVLVMEKVNKLNHPNIVRLIEVLETPTQIYVVMEALRGGELFDRIVKKHHYSEEHAAEVLRTLAGALSALHDNGIVHRDMKPENLIYETESEESVLKIIDFGLAMQTDDEDGDPYEGRVVGTPGYFAPESFLRKEYSTQCDVYSLGVILYILLSGFPPFSSKSSIELYQKMQKEEYVLEKWGWEDISDDAKDLVQSMLRADPKKRCTLDEVLRHKWASPDEKNRTEHLKGTVKRMITFNARRKLRSAVKAIMSMNRLAQMASSSHDIGTHTVPTRKRLKRKQSISSFRKGPLRDKSPRESKRRKRSVTRRRKKR